MKLMWNLNEASATKIWLTVLGIWLATILLLCFLFPGCANAFSAQMCKEFSVLAKNVAQARDVGMSRKEAAKLKERYLKDHPLPKHSGDILDMLDTIFDAPWDCPQCSVGDITGVIGVGCILGSELND